MALQHYPQPKHPEDRHGHTGHDIAMPGVPGLMGEYRLSKQHGITVKNPIAGLYSLKCCAFLRSTQRSIADGGSRYVRRTNKYGDNNW